MPSCAPGHTQCSALERFGGYEVAKSVVVLGVGASNGVGGALARRFASEGLHAIIAGRTLEKVEAVADMIKHAGGSAEAVRTDVTSPQDQEALFETVKARGQVAAVLYNAGNNMIIPLEQLEPETFEAFWRVGPWAHSLRPSVQSRSSRRNARAACSSPAPQARCAASPTLRTLHP